MSRRFRDATVRCGEMRLVRAVCLEQDVRRAASEFKQTHLRSLSLLAGFIFRLYQLKKTPQDLVYMIILGVQQRFLSSFVPCQVRTDTMNIHLL